MSAIPRLVRFNSKAPKFKNRKTEIDGHVFDSKREAKRYGELKLLLANDRIRNLELQQVFTLNVLGKKVCTYRADFTYQEYVKGEWVNVTEDVKGFATPVYRLKRKLMLAVHGIVIRET